MFEQNLKNKAAETITLLKNNNLKISCAESCTGGLLSALLTEIAGASQAFDRGFVTYCNQAKIDLLQVKSETLKNHGAVSEEVAEEMAIGAIKNSQSQISVAITGIAGPSGDSTTKPIGLVYVACCGDDLKPIVKKYNFSGDRKNIRYSSVAQALNDLQNFLWEPV